MKTYVLIGILCAARDALLSANPRVADASVMPAIPRVNINLTCIMIGEYVSDWMCDEA